MQMQRVGYVLEEALVSARVHAHWMVGLDIDRRITEMIV